MLQLNRLKRHLFDSSPLQVDLFFPRGLFGFEGYTRYSLIGEPQKAPLIRLESTENDALSFYVIDPFIHCPVYAPTLTQSDLKDVNVIHEAKLVLLTIVDTGRRTPTMNLGAPLLIHWSKRLGKQLLIHAETEYPVRLNI